MSWVGNSISFFQFLNTVVHQAESTQSEVKYILHYTGVPKRKFMEYFGIIKCHIDHIYLMLHIMYCNVL